MQCSKVSFVFCCWPIVGGEGKTIVFFLIWQLVCCIYVTLTTFVTVFMLFLFYCCIETQRWQVKNTVCFGRMICFQNKHELQLIGWLVLFYNINYLTSRCMEIFNRLVWVCKARKASRQFFYNAVSKKVGILHKM